MDNRGSSGGGSFEVEHGPDAVEVLDVHKAGSREVGYVVREREMLIKNYTKIANRGVGGESER